MDSYDVLVIILSVTLAIFLILAIIALILLIKLLKKIHKITDSAEQLVQNIESFSESMIKASGPINAVRTVFSIFNGKSRKERG